MSHDDKSAINPLHALLAEFGIVDPLDIADAKEQHDEIIAAYHDGKLTEAALRHSLARAYDHPHNDTPNVAPVLPDRNEQ